MPKVPGSRLTVPGTCVSIRVRSKRILTNANLLEKGGLGVGIFTKKKKIVKEIHDGIWGHLVAEHGIDVDTLTNDFRCVEKDGLLEGGRSVTFLRVFSLKELEQNGVTVTGWETFDERPELIRFEGYLSANNQAALKPPQVSG